MVSLETGLITCCLAFVVELGFTIGFFTGIRTVDTLSGVIERPLVVSRGEIVTPRFKLLVA